MIKTTTQSVPTLLRKRYELVLISLLGFCINFSSLKAQTPSINCSFDYSVGFSDPGAQYVFFNWEYQSGGSSWLSINTLPGSSSSRTSVSFSLQDRGTLIGVRRGVSTGGIPIYDYQYFTYPVTPSISESITPSTCGSADGSITVQDNSGNYSQTPRTFTLLQNGIVKSSSQASAASYTFNGLAAGTYTVRIDMGCNTLVTEKTVTVGIAIGLIANAGLDQTICAGSTAQLWARATGGTTPYNYLWDNGSGSSIIIVSPTSTTTYSLTVTDSKGCTSTDQVVVKVDPSPVTNAGADKAICNGSSTSLTAITTGGTIPYT
jgi:hypothetical protein